MFIVDEVDLAIIVQAVQCSLQLVHVLAVFQGFPNRFLQGLNLLGVYLVGFTGLDLQYLFEFGCYLFGCFAAFGCAFFPS